MPRPTRTILFAAGATATALLAACGPQAEEVGPATTPESSGADGDPVEMPTAFSPGDYEATGSYQTPGGVQSVDVEVTLEADGTIVDVDVDGNAEGGNSEQFQDKFESGIEAQVEGRKITELEVDKVSGSSLTSGGFNDAIAHIIEEARA